VIIPRIDSNRVDPRALETNVFDKLFSSGVDHAHHSGGGTPCRLAAGIGVREVVVVGPRIVPDLV
jgi:hypothetical protein